VVAQFNEVNDQLSGVGERSVIGSIKKFPAPRAAIPNATTVTMQDFDDTHGEFSVYPSSVILTTSLVIGEAHTSMLFFITFKGLKREEP
jgi:2-methylcitrate dehydratase PrpD